jgi:hypothetical protein
MRRGGGISAVAVGCVSSEDAVVRRTVSIEQKAAWLRDANGAAAQPVADPLPDRYFSVKEIADRLNLSQDSVRKLFQNEPGVLVLGDQSSKYKRRYTTLRIPEPVLQRVLRRNSNV